MKSHNPQASRTKGIRSHSKVCPAFIIAPRSESKDLQLIDRDWVLKDMNTRFIRLSIQSHHSYMNISNIYIYIQSNIPQKQITLWDLDLSSQMWRDSRESLDDYHLGEIINQTFFLATNSARWLVSPWTIELWRDSRDSSHNLGVGLILPGVIPCSMVWVGFDQVLYSNCDGISGNPSKICLSELAPAKSVPKLVTPLRRFLSPNHPP